MRHDLQRHNILFLRRERWWPPLSGSSSSNSWVCFRCLSACVCSSLEFRLDSSIDQEEEKDQTQNDLREGRRWEGEGVKQLCWGHMPAPQKKVRSVPSHIPGWTSEGGHWPCHTPDQSVWFNERCLGCHRLAREEKKGRKNKKKKKNLWKRVHMPNWSSCPVDWQIHTESPMTPEKARVEKEK